MSKCENCPNWQVNLYNGFHQCKGNLCEKEVRADERRNTIDDFIDVVLNGYTFNNLNRKALEFILNDAKNDLLRKEQKNEMSISEL